MSGRPHVATQLIYSPISSYPAGDLKIRLHNKIEEAVSRHEPGQAGRDAGVTTENQNEDVWTQPRI
jgi:hypothetical protein